MNGTGHAGRWEKGLLLGLTLVALAVSGVRPHDRATWWLEVAPVLIALPVLIATGRRWPLTPLLYRLLFVHGLILILGGHYTYARVPPGDWLAEWFGFERNHYDRIGHLAQGFVPAILAREVLLRFSPLGRGAWLNLFVVSVCLAFSAFYELIEWWVAVLAGGDDIAFLGTQGDVWDTHWDMFLCLLGALAALVMLSRVHDRSLANLAASSPSRPAGGLRHA